MARLFADDTSRSFSSIDPAELERILNADLNKLSTWVEIWVVLFNAKKNKIK